MKYQGFFRPSFLQNATFLSITLLLTLSISLFLALSSGRQKQVLTQNASGPSCNNTGVTHNPDGSYSFAQLTVDSHGNIVDVNNPSCVIHLLGMNQGWFTSGAGGGPDASEFDWFKQHIQYNIIRVAFNSTWWKDSAQDTSKDIDYNYGVNLRQALINFVHLAESKGLYVELDLDSQFITPPCDLQHPQCTQASQGSQDWDNPSSPYYHDPLGQELSAYQPTALWTLNDMANTFKNDPAVIIDVWNEPAFNETKMPDPQHPGTRAPITEDVFFKNMQDRVAVVSSAAPNTMIVVYVRALSDIMQGPSSQFPIFTQKNIMYDDHIYQAGNFPTNAQQKADFARQHGQAYTIGEWGGKSEIPNAQSMGQFLGANNVNSTYFAADNFRQGGKKNPTWDQIGTDVANAYATIFGSPQPTGNGTPIPPISVPPASPPFASPTLFCMGSCPNPSSPLPSTSPIPSGGTPLPSIPVSTSPLPQPSLSLSPSETPSPCTTTTQVGAAAGLAKGRHKTTKRQSLLQRLLNLIQQLLNRILRLLGKTPVPPTPCPPIPTPQPSTPVVTPTCMPRPVCLDTVPRCTIPEPKGGWCPVGPTPSGCHMSPVVCPNFCIAGKPCPPCKPTLICPSTTPQPTFTCSPLPQQCRNTGKPCPLVPPVGGWCPI